MQSPPLRIIGIDPGTAITGWGFLEYHSNQSFNQITYNCITTAAHTPLSQRLGIIYDQTCQLISQYQPHAISIEKLFFNTNAKTAMAVGHARGVLVLAAIKAEIPIYEYTPLQIKQALTGYGRADKPQMQQMVKTILRLQQLPKPDDAADALAAAITHAFSHKTNLQLTNQV